MTETTTPTCLLSSEHVQPEITPPDWCHWLEAIRLVVPERQWVPRVLEWHFAQAHHAPPHLANAAGLPPA